MSDNKGKIVFIDLETGGLTYHPHMVNGALKPMNPIIQIACAVVDCGTLDVIDTYESKVAFSESECDPQALVINGYQKENWKDAKCKTAALIALSAFLKKHATVTKMSKRTGNPYTVAQLGGQNAAGFDVPYLRSWYDKEFFPADYHVIDCMVLAHLYSALTGIKFGSLSQDALAKHFKIEFNGRSHDALVDVQVTAKIYKAMITDLKKLIEF